VIELQSRVKINMTIGWSDASTVKIYKIIDIFSGEFFSINTHFLTRGLCVAHL